MLLITILPYYARAIILLLGLENQNLDVYLEKLQRMIVLTTMEEHLLGMKKFRENPTQVKTGPHFHTNFDSNSTYNATMNICSLNGSIIFYQNRICYQILLITDFK